MDPSLPDGTAGDSAADAAAAAAAAATNTIAASATTPLARTRANATTAGEIRSPTAGEVLDLFEVNEGALLLRDLIPIKMLPFWRLRALIRDTTHHPLTTHHLPCTTFDPACGGQKEAADR